MVKNHAVILGMSITGFGTARALGKENIPVTGIDFDRPSETFWTKYAKKTIIKNSSAPESVIEFLISYGKQFSEKPVLYVDRDEYVFLVSKHRNNLERFYSLCIPCDEVIELINNKYSLTREARIKGISIPETTVFKGNEISQNVMAWNSFPAVIKPLYGYMVFTGAGFKTKIINDKESLFRCVTHECPEMFQFLLQEMIPGDDDAIYSVCAYFNNQSKPLATFVFQKICQSPRGNGIGIVVKSADIPESEKKIISFLESCKFQGIAEVEVKQDSRDNLFKLIEINTRPWLQIELSRKCDQNIALISYLDLCGKFHETANYQNKKNSFYWIMELPFIIMFFRERQWRNLTLKKAKRYLSIIFNNRIQFALLSFYDPKPFLRLVLSVIKRFIKKHCVV